MPKSLLQHLIRGASSPPWDAWARLQGKGLASTFSRDPACTEPGAKMLPGARIAKGFGGLAAFCCVVWAFVMFQLSPHSKHLVDAMLPMFSCHVAFASALFFTRKVVSLSVMCTFAIMWMISIAVIADCAMRFGTISSACLIVIPVLAGMVGGGRYTALATVAALSALAANTWLGSLVEHDLLDFNQVQLLVTNFTIEIFASSLVVWLFSHLLERMEGMERESIEWGMMLARDIRTPMHGLLGLLDGLDASDLADADNSKVHMLSGCSRMMLAILDTMLGSPKVGIHSRLQTVLLSDLVYIKHIAQAMACQKAQNVSVELHSHGRPCVAVRLLMSDFLQVLGNLLSNAVKFSPAGSHITVVFTTEWFEGQEVCALTVEVVDCGPGVPADLRKKIFKPFERGRLKSAEEGVGLGLSIVADIVSTMGGSVECRARTDKASGASFVVRFARLPVATTTTVDSGSEQTINARAEDYAAVGRILIVDDNALNLLLLSRFLQRSGVPREDIVTSTSGEAALGLVASETRPFGAAILDMVLPGIDGVELAARLAVLHRHCFPDAPSIVLLGATSSLTPSVHDAWNRVGVVCQFTKPFQRTSVAEMIAFVRFRRSTVQHELPHFSCDSLQGRDCPPLFGLQAPVVAVRVELLAGLVSLVPILCISRYLSSVAFGVGFSHFGDVCRSAFACAAVALRFAVRKHPNYARALFLSTCFIWVSVKTCMSFGSFAGYAFVPILAGLLYGCSAVTKSFIACIAFQVLLLALKFYQLVPHSVYTPASRSQEQIDISSFIMAASACILVYLSLMTLLQQQRMRWTNTLSHDLRAPLHGMLASISELMESGRLSPKSLHSIRMMQTCASTVLAVTDTVLAIAAQHCTTPTVVTVGELTLELENILDTFLERKIVFVMDSSADSGSEFLCNRSALTYALTQIAAAASLLSLSRSKIRFAIRYDRVTLTLVITVEESDRQLSVNAVKHDPSRLGDSSATVWGEHVGQSALVRIVRGILHGTVQLLVDETALYPSKPWRLTIAIPVVPIMADKQTEPKAAPMECTNVRVAVVDDSLLNLRICKRLLARCGVKSMVLYSSSAEAISALDNGLLDSISLFLVDLNMPQISGLEFARYASKRFSEHSIARPPALVACTGDVSLDAHAEAVRAGMQHLLIKPFGREHLMEVMCAALNR